LNFSEFYPISPKGELAEIQKYSEIFSFIFCVSPLEGIWGKHAENKRIISVLIQPHEFSYFVKAFPQYSLSHSKLILGVLAK
jgi:hypothetical protein